MKEDFSELVEYLDKKFGTVATRSDVDHRFDVVATEVVNLRTEMEHGFADIKKDFRELQSAVSTYATRADTYFQEMVMPTQRVRRLEQWVEDLAAKAGVKLKS